ncbi:MAG: 4-alpha-glucanotransferase [Candidatus Borkfalkiaceae bacterium]|nr:4-alpha-glucanotransferase [Clostridia bacterium]MDY6223741.1 4-alpha-glucanotransferase [Christensenellaceae bacterium]
MTECAATENDRNKNDNAERTQRMSGVYFNASGAAADNWKRRRSGVLLPIFSLPGEYGIGSIGAEATRFIDYLADAGVKVWQILPLLPTGYGDSPYQSVCSYALNYYFIDLPTLQREGLLTEEELESAKSGEERGGRIDYEALFFHRVPLLKRAFSRFASQEYATHSAEDASEFEEFKREGEYYDFALFMSLKAHFSYRPYTEWGEFSVYEESRAEQFAKEHEEEVNFWQFTQYEFLKQWKKLRAHAKERGVEIFGDMPVYVSGDSVEMWKYGKILFETDENGAQTLKAGVPPDAFSADGQLWGNPVYRWSEMKKDGYLWWKKRIIKAFTLFDLVRIDHFRAFDRYYVTDAGATTAREGRWEEGPKEELFEGLPDLPIVAEDLGVIDEGVLRLMKNTGFPGMRVLEFAFDGGEDNTNKPSNSPENSVTYTGTHDNAPFRAFVESLEGWEKERFEYAFKRECEKFGFTSFAVTPEEYCADAVRLAFASPSFLCVAPVQDLLALGEEARINAPSTLSVLNWSYRFSEDALFSGETKERLRALIEEYGRGGE